ncbi:putative histidine kinase-like ATPase domain-containing protein [Rosa chinensis]|uniref:Putative histidine kinase-like ATPase domain-containing protein n=1 Tax=Rosa chinensis TaxID=74649 RepID=A0A2P6QVX5_ROSCH|nr:putative histidine kinase-like ATPase domain-containing protein [Rosa chinensis]
MGNPSIEAMQHIEEIRTNKFSIGKKEPNPLTLDLHHAVTSLSAELYQKDIHFLMELIQNAEDNEYKEGVEPTLEFVLTEKDITGTGAPATLLVFNNEVGFSRENIDSICSIGRSTKKGKRRQGFIGEKGIGFKSVFLVSSQPHIFSNGYHVKFREEPNQVCGIGYIVPEWFRAADLSVLMVQAVYGHGKDLPTTTFVLPLKRDKVEAVRAQLLELHPEILLFLSKIKRLYVRGCDPQKADDVSTLSIFSETEHTELRSKTANSRVVQLSVKEKMCDTEQLCKYYLWREEFPVKPGNRVEIRMDVEKWVITLAFPFGKRLRRGTSPVGIFAFLPTTMVTNFPFVVQADFILASSRESIILDNSWNMGILQCVPSAFVNAFQHCVGQLNLFSSVSQPFEFLPAQNSPTPEFNTVQESIRTRLQGLNIVPCKRFFGDSLSSKLPRRVVRIKPKFRDLVVKIKAEGAVFGSSSSSSLKRVLDSSLDVEKYRDIMNFLGVAYADDDWYTACINSCNLLLLSDEVYIELLGFLADNDAGFDSDSIETIPLLKYTDRKGSLALCTIKTTEVELKIRYAMGLELHTWLSKCNMEFGCPDNVYFLPNKTLEAVLNHQKSHPPKRRYRKKNYMESSSVCNWLNRSAGVKSLSAYDYAFLLLNHVSKKESNVAVRLSNFLYLAHKEGFLTEYQISDLCGRIPIVDGSDKVRVQRTVTLVPSSGSKWAKLFGLQNPFAEQHYVDIGDVYAKSSLFLGKYSTPEKELLYFVGEYSKATDLPDLCPPDVVLQIASHELSSEQAFLLLDWIRLLRTKNSSIPKNFIESIENGKWMKTFSGYKSPQEVIFPDETGKVIFDLMKHVLEDVAILDQEFYMNKIKLYQDELKFLGVRLGSENIGKLVTTRFLSLASSGMSKESTYSLLTFISFSRGRSMVDNGWLAVMKEKKWLKTLRGYNPPNGSILLLQSEIEVENCSKVTNLPIVDEAFYGSRLGSFLSELRLLGVTYDADVLQRLVAENVNLTSNLSSMTGGCGLLILKCVRWLGSGAAGLINRIKCHPWVKTTLGFKSPSETVLPDPKWVSLLSTLQVPAIDELYYDNAIRQFVDELNALGVVVDNTGTTVMIAARFKSLLSSSSLDPATVMALLRCIREMNLTMSLQHSELQWLLSEKWLKTRHGFKTPDESIIFSSKWGQLMLFVDLPLIDDVYYGTGIYKFRDELEKLGAITDFERGALFVAKGLHSPIEAELLDADGIRSLLECIKSLMSRSLDDPLVGDFLKNIANSRCLKTTNGYKVPEDCILFDSSWECILNRLDAPSIDEAFYRTDISAYKNQLRDVGVKVDPQDVCSLLSGHLLSLTDTASITRIYSFLNKFQWSPKVLNKCNSQVWIPEPKSKAGAWAKSQCCVLHDKKNLFGSCLFSLDKSYSKELLPIFSTAFGVPENPSIKDYLLLWDIWASMNNSKVTVEKCSSFWKCIVDNWNPHIEETLKQNLTKVPATMSMSGQIYLIRKEEAFIADDLQLKTIFSSFDKAPLFVWFPNSSSSVPHRRLLEIYESLGVRKISASVKCTVKGMLSSEHWEKVEQNNGLIGRSLTKIVLAFLAGPELNMPFKERLEAAKSMSVLTAYKTDKPIKVCYRLMPCASTTVEVEKLKLVLWEKDSKRLFIDKSGYDGGKCDLEFVTSFANELAQELLAQARPAAAHALSRIIQMAYIYGFNENEVEFLLMTENLELFVEDKKFLDDAYPVSQKRTSKKLEQLGPSTPMPTCKKQRK